MPKRPLNPTLAYKLFLMVVVLFPSYGLAGGNSFYKSPSLYSTRPKEVHKFEQSVNRFGPVGIGIELTQPAFGMKVKNVEPGSPAGKSGKLKTGQVIVSINGEVLKDIDPRIQLGNIITQAEATDGRVIFMVRESTSSKTQEVVVNIPVLGSYRKSWPLNCPKSDRIVRELAKKFKEEGHSGGLHLDGPKILFMLSTGDDDDLEVVKGWMKTIVKNNQDFGKGLTYQWFVSWGAPPIAEYYLRTGDASVLPLMQKICNAVKKTQYQGGWGGRGLSGHHMGLAGTGTLTFLLLAKKCGVEVDKKMLHSALAHYYRFAGRGTNPYMDHYPESTFTDNGRNGRLALAMKVASELRPEGEKSLYSQASDISSIKSFYSTSYMLHGHTGGGIGEVWRSASMGLMEKKSNHHYREFMDQRTWFYDLSRRYDGSFGIVGGGERYDKTSWGISMGLAYTAPRKNLVIFGAPSENMMKGQKDLPMRCWGNEADDAFLSMQAPVSPSGKIRNFNDEKVSTDTGVPVDRLMDLSSVTDLQILKFIYHREHRFREKGAHAIKKHQRQHLILGLLEDTDPRVRNAGVMACESFMLTDPIASQTEMVMGIKTKIFTMLNNSKEAWFTTTKILDLVSGFSVDELLPHSEKIAEFLGHEEWWVRHSALNAIVPLMLSEKSYQKVLPGLEKHLPNFYRSNWGFVKRLAEAKAASPKVQKAILKTLGSAYLAFPGPKAQNPDGGTHPQTEQWISTLLAYAINKIPGGLETLFEVSKKRFPEKDLLHRDLFLSGTKMKVENEKLKAVLREIIKNELIPDQVGKNWKSLKAFSSGESGKASSMTTLQQLYSQAGIEDFSWKSLGKKQQEMTWSYHSFDPPETWFGKSDRLGRYRKVTFPSGMEDWYKPEFDPIKNGWKQGMAPFGSSDGEKAYFTGSTKVCGMSFCECGGEPKTLWEKDVIMLHGQFELPPFEEGYCYRLLHGGISHVGSGGGYRVYINGKLFHENKSGTDRRGGGVPKGKVITKDWWPHLSKGKVTLAAVSFMKNHPRTKKFGGNFSIFLERMKVPPLKADILETFATTTAFMTSEWQAFQDPGRIVEEPDEGKYFWDGSFEANPSLLGSWKSISLVNAIHEFNPRTSKSRRGIPFSKIILKGEGKTDHPQRLWSGKTLMDLQRGQALKMNIKIVNEKEYLVVEAGGFSSKQPVAWECPLVIFSRE